MLFWGIKFLGKERAFGQADFPRDQLILYQGFFGVPSYVIWYAAPWPDKPLDIETGTQFTFFLSNGEKITFEGEFLIKEILYDMSKKMYKIFAVSSPYIKLSETIGFGYLPLSKEPINGIEVIQNLLKGTLGANFNVIAEKNIENIYKYTQFSYDTSFSALDIISKICGENMWEWYLTPVSICIGTSLYSTEFYAASHIPIKEHGKVWETEWTYSVSMEAYPAEPMSLFGKNKARVLWVKYNIGDRIDSLMTFLAQKPNLHGQYFPISEKGFVQTLTGEAKKYGLHRYYKSYNQLPLLLGKIHKDFTGENVKEYEAPIFDGDVDDISKDLKRRTFFKDSPNFPKLHLENVKMTTPYAGDGVGLLFPQDESYRTLFTPNGEREMALIGPAYFGMGDEIPAKSDPKDFRLQLPDQTVIYNKNDDTLYINAKKKIEISMGGISPQLLSSTGGPHVTIENNKVTISNKAISTNVIVVDGSSVSVGIAPTLKVTPGQVEILGTLKINGMIDVLTLKSAIHPNIDAAIKTKIPPLPV